MTRFKTLALAALAVSALTFATAPQAEARGRGIGFGLGALAAGVVVGGAALAIANSNAYAAPAYGDCYLTRQWVDTPYGPVRRTVRVFDLSKAPPPSPDMPRTLAPAGVLGACRGWEAGSAAAALFGAGCRASPSESPFEIAHRNRSSLPLPGGERSAEGRERGN
ncbi:MAG: hypothetical protein J0H01_38665, partial [Rhizobiales bacterium]|nr:hypothetical protein [Hyphomicrobiales bacterium]